jgi:hypothetical protein
MAAILPKLSQNFTSVGSCQILSHSTVVLFPSLLPPPHLFRQRLSSCFRPSTATIFCKDTARFASQPNKRRWEFDTSSGFFPFQK